MRDGKLTAQELAALDVDPTLPGHPDPYPIFHRLRDQDPVHFCSQMNGWVLSRYADAAAYLRDYRFSRKAYLDDVEQRYGKSPVLDVQRREFSFLDPPRHSLMRGLAGKAFTPQRIEAMRPNIEKMIDARLVELEPRGRMDVIADLAYPLPAMVIAAMLGVSEADSAMLRKHVDGFVMARGIVRDQKMLDAGDRSIRAFHDYLLRLYEERTRTPGADLMSALIAAEDGGARLSVDDILSFVTTLFAAGHATTRSLVANGMLALLRHPDQMRMLRETPALIVSAVEEMLRYDAPTQAPSPQVATEDLEIGGCRVRKGEAVSVLIGACNRDPARFPDPDRFDITRKDNEHLAFSFGPHYCLGAALARAEAQIAMAAMVRTLPGMRLAIDQPEYERMGRFRVMKSLPVEW